MSLLSTFAAGSIRGFAAKFIPNISNLYQWGRQAINTISFEKPYEIIEYTQVPQITQTFTKIAVGVNHGIAIDDNGNLYGWGANAQGQVGDNSGDSYVSSPVLVSGTGDWADIAAGYLFSTAIKSDGTLWAWGYGFQGQIGQNNTFNVSAPTQIGSLTTWTEVAAGYAHAAAVRSDGTLWAWGEGTSGQLGNGSNINRSSPVQISGTSWRNVGCNSYNTFASTTTNTIQGTGTNTNGQLGYGDVINKSSMVQLIGGNVWSRPAKNMYATHCWFKRTDNSWWVSGRGSEGQFGNNTVGNVSSPVQLSGSWSDVSSYQLMSIGRTPLGALYSWGNNNNWLLGTPTSNNSAKGNRSSPVQIGSQSWSYFSGFSDNILAVEASTNDVYAVGQAGLNASLSTDFVYNVNISVPYLWNGSLKWRSVDNTSYAFMGVTVDNKLYVVGNNFSTPYGELGLQDSLGAVFTSPTQVGSLTDWATIHMNDTSRSTLSLKTDGTIWGWGWNRYGNLGVGDVNARSSPVQIGVQTDWEQIRGGSQYFMIARNSTGQIYSAGRGNAGQTGLNNTLSAVTLSEIGSNFGAADIGAGFYNGYAVKTNGTLWGWGYNAVGSVGNGAQLDISSPVQIGALTNWSKVYGGHYVAYSIKTDGTLWAWGSNDYGQLGQNDVVYRSSPVQIGFDTNWTDVSSRYDNQPFTILKKSNGTIWYLGYPPLGNGTSASSPVQIGSDTNWDKIFTGYNGGATKI